jgi:hypothetical protein
MKILRQMTLCLTGVLLSASMLLPMTAWAQDEATPEETVSERDARNAKLKAEREAKNARLKEKRETKNERRKEKREEWNEAIQERREDRREGLRDRIEAREERYEEHMENKPPRQREIIEENQFHHKRMTRIDKMESDASTAKDSAMVLKAKQMRQEELTRHQSKLREINAKYAN